MTRTQLRTLAAFLLCTAGIGLVSSLWFRPLDLPGLVDAILGGIYLITAIGLFGLSRFSLFVAVLIPGTDAFLLYQSATDHSEIVQLRMINDIVIAGIAAFELWRARRNPSI